VFQKSLIKLDSRWAKAAKFGWYPGADILVNLSERTLSTPEALSVGMISRIERKLKDIEVTVVKDFPHRKQILTEAFRLHKEGRYIASIPLFLSQAEGVFQEAFKKSFYSRRQGRDKKIQAVLNQELDDAFNVFMSKSLVSNELGERSSRSEEEHKSKGPNRNGILHGEAGHLDYGTSENSFKAISLVAYASFMASTYLERINET